MEAIPKTFTQDPVFRKLSRSARCAVFTEQDKVAYRKSLKIYRDTYAIAETERAEGRAEIAQAERRKSIRMMLSFGIPAEQIADKYGMSVMEVTKLAESNS